MSCTPGRLTVLTSLSFPWLQLCEHCCVTHSPPPRPIALLRAAFLPGMKKRAKDILFEPIDWRLVHVEKLRLSGCKKPIAATPSPLSQNLLARAGSSATSGRKSFRLTRYLIQFCACLLLPWCLAGEARAVIGVSVQMLLGNPSGATTTTTWFSAPSRRWIATTRSASRTGPVGI